MATVSDLSRRHLTIRTPGAIHFVHVKLVRDVIAGRQPVEVLSEPVVRRIIEEWLVCVYSHHQI